MKQRSQYWYAGLTRRQRKYMRAAKITQGDHRKEQDIDPTYETCRLCDGKGRRMVNWGNESGMRICCDCDGTGYRKIGGVR